MCLCKPHEYTYNWLYNQYVRKLSDWAEWFEIRLLICLAFWGNEINFNFEVFILHLLNRWLEKKFLAKKEILVSVVKLIVLFKKIEGMCCILFTVHAKIINKSDRARWLPRCIEITLYKHTFKEKKGSGLLKNCGFVLKGLLYYVLVVYLVSLVMICNVFGNYETSLVCVQEK